MRPIGVSSLVCKALGMGVQSEGRYSYLCPWGRGAIFLTAPSEPAMSAVAGAALGKAPPASALCIHIVSFLRCQTHDSSS